MESSGLAEFIECQTTYHWLAYAFLLYVVYIIWSLGRPRKTVKNYLGSEYFYREEIPAQNAPTALEEVPLYARRTAEKEVPVQQDTHTAEDEELIHEMETLEDETERFDEVETLLRNMIDAETPEEMERITKKVKSLLENCNGTAVPGLDFKVTKGDEGKLLRLIAEEPKRVTT